MAVLGGNKVEPPCRGASQRLAWFEVGRLGVRHIAGAGMMGGPRPWNNGERHIISCTRQEQALPGTVITQEVELRVGRAMELRRHRTPRPHVGGSPVGRR